MLTETCSVRLEVASTLVRLALLYVIGDRGWGTCAHEGACRCLVVSDRLPAGRCPIDVLVVRDEPAACQDAIQAALSGRVRSVVLWNEPEGIAAACEGLGEGLAVIPLRVLELGSRAPRLSDRQRETLCLLARGTSSTDIAGALHQSQSTAKRDIAELLHLFDAPNRAALISSAATLGYVTLTGDPTRARVPPEAPGQGNSGGKPTILRPNGSWIAGGLIIRR